MSITESSIANLSDFDDLDPNRLYFIPLGGSSEVGMNLNVYVYQQSILLVDFGVSFSNSELGIEVIAPSIEALKPYRNRIAGLILTHAHEDHYGAVPYLWKELQCPIFASPFAKWLLEEKLYEHKERLNMDLAIHEVPSGGRVNVGLFEIYFFPITHSIPESHSLCITTPLGVIFHTGDWKLDLDPVIGEPTCMETLREIRAKHEILAVVGDSTNVFEVEPSGSEITVQESLDKWMGRMKGRRVIVACFASNVARLKSCLDVAQKHGRQAILAGRSLKRFNEGARYIGLLDQTMPFSDAESFKFLPRDKVLLVVTGSQGEEKAALSRLATKKLNDIDLETGDVVIFSSRIIPGNEKQIYALQNLLISDGIEVLTTKDDETLHVSGHPSQLDLKTLYNVLNPSMVIPVHGEIRHLVQHAKLARSWGYGTIDYKSMGNGVIIDITQPGQPQCVGRMDVKKIFLDGRNMIPLDGIIIKQRKQMASDGCVVAIIRMDGQESSKCFLTFLGLVGGNVNPAGVLKRCIQVVQDLIKTTYTQESTPCIQDVYNVLEKQIWNCLKKRPLIQITVIGQDGFLKTHDPSSHERQPVYRRKNSYSHYTNKK